METNLNDSDEGIPWRPEPNSSALANVSLIAPEPSDEQKIFLVNYLKSYPYLLSANPASSFTNRNEQDSWQELVNLLNSFGTSVKSAEDWKKYWAEMMSHSEILLRRAEMDDYNIDIEFWKKRKPMTLPSAEQKDFLINFVMENHAVMYHKDHRRYDRKKRTKKWKELTDILNSMDGPKKSAEKWKASWNAIALRAKTAVAKGETNYGDRVAAVIAFLYPERTDLHRKILQVDKSPTNCEEPQSESVSEFFELPQVPSPVATTVSEFMELPQEPSPVVTPEPVILPREIPTPAKKVHHKVAGSKKAMFEYEIEQEKLEIQKKFLALEEKQTVIEELRANALECMLKREETKINDSTRILLQTKRLEIAYRQAKEEEATLTDIGKFVVMTEAKSKLLLDVLTKVTDVVNNSY